MGKKRIDELKRQIEQLRKQFPAHMIPPVMMEKLDDLEEELEMELAKLSKEQKWHEEGSNH